MGSCISKCRPKKCYIEDFSHHVQDKLVISQAPKTPNIPVSNKISPFPLSPTTTSSSSSSFTCSSSNTTTTSSCSSLSSSASSVLTSKDRSFSNEFLWACVKENPHIIRINSIKEASLALATAKSPTQKKLDSPGKPAAAPGKQGLPQREKGSTPLKRGRSSSPTTLTRQKSLRKEPDRLNSAYYLPSRSLGSPSPSRRFSNGDYGRGILASTSKEVCSSKRIVGPKVNALNSVSSSQRKDSCRPSSPMLMSSHPSPLKSCLRNRETFIHRISSKIDETALRAALSSQQENESITMEDIDNPLISLDCFIFL